jgi:hypothetical protein
MLLFSKEGKIENNDWLRVEGFVISCRYYVLGVIGTLGCVCEDKMGVLTD